MPFTIVDQWRTYAPNDSPWDADIGGGDILVDPAGYLPKSQELAALAQSGESLDEYRRLLYPNMLPVSQEDAPVFDPTAQMGYDFFDYHDDVVFVATRLSEQQRRSGIVPADVLPLTVSKDDVPAPTTPPTQV